MPAPKQDRNHRLRRIDNCWGGGGGIFIYSYSALLISLVIDCFYPCEHEYMNFAYPNIDFLRSLRFHQQSNIDIG